MEDLAEQVDPGAVASYLTLAGWQSVRGNARRSIWEHASGVRVFVPGGRGPDTEDLVHLALRDIAKVERRDEDEVATDIAWRQFDRLFLRRAAPTSALPISDALGLHDALNDLITAAALAANETRRVYIGRRPGTVDSYVENIRLVPPTAGSFVVRALLPMNVKKSGEDTTVLPLPGFEAPEVRHISRTILQSSHEAVRAAHDVAHGADLSRWDEAVTSGVSANLCDALARLPGEQSEYNPGVAELRIEWSWAAPGEPLQPVAVHSGLSPILFAASDYLRGTAEEHTIRIVGRVTKLHREAATGPGEITVKGQVDRWDLSLRSVRVPLDEQSYRTALRAHDEGETVAVVARIRREAQRTDVLHTEDLSVLASVPG